MNARSLLFAAAAATAGLSAGAQMSMPSGIDLAAIDRTVRPQDDMFRYANGEWLKSTAIPPDRPYYTAFVALADQAEHDAQSLIQEEAATPGRTPGSIAQQVGDLYASFMDEATVRRLGGAPLAPVLETIRGIGDVTALARVIGDLSMDGISGPVVGSISPDKADPSRMALTLYQADLALPDRDYYLKDDARFADVRARYRQFLERMFALAGWPEPAQSAKDVLGLETALARIQWTRVESRDAEKTYNRYARARVAAEMPGFDWAAWGRAQGMNVVDDWIIAQPSYFKAFAAMVPEVPLDTWKDWIAAQVIILNAPYLSDPFVDASFDFFGRTLNGQQENRVRWKRAVAFVNGSMGFAVGQLYVARHFPPDARTRMQVLVGNLLEAYRQSISELDWMTPATRQEALAKLAKIRTKIGYPDKWRDYRALDVAPGDLFGNARRARRFANEYELAKLTRPVDRTEWWLTPQTVNAYYDPGMNEIVFPAAILQPPFFNPSADDAANYGAIGAVIGHEIGHAFDDQGSKYDGDGRLRNWWTPRDAAEFKARTAKLVDQFNGYAVLPDLHVNGALTLGENIGDLGGLSIAHRAWKIALAGRTPPVIDGLTGEQRYFMGWAQVWRAKGRPEFMQRITMSDPHAWPEFRANGALSNVPEFYTAFDVKPGDGMYRAPADRVKIW